MSSDSLKYDANGLVTVIAQDRLTGEVRMLAHANAQAIDATLESGEAHFWSRSRASLWKKGESSGHVLSVFEVWVDCDRDAVLYLVDPAGPSCHTGKPNCFFDRRLGSGEGDRAMPLLMRLEEALAARAHSTEGASYTKSLLQKGALKIGEKLREEADELARAIAEESDERVASEAADLMYHMLVGLLSREVSFREVEAKLAARFGVSGHTEKASRAESKD